MADDLERLERVERVFERLEVLELARRLSDWPLDAQGRTIPSDAALEFVEDFFSDQYDVEEKRTLAYAKTIIDLIRGLDEDLV